MIQLLQDLLFYGLPIIVILGVVVTVHELGHFLAARAFGTSVDRFSIGFGRAIFQWRDRAGVEWRIGWIPLGGYVRFSGDETAASIPDAEDLEALRRDLLAREGPQALSRYFHFKPVWQRAAIVAAGPVANFLLAIAILASLLMSFGEQFHPARVEGVKADSPAERAGFRVGDVILRVNGKAVDGADDVDKVVMLSSGTPLDFVVARDDRDVRLTATPERGTVIDQLGKPQELGVLGLIQPARVGGVLPNSPAARGGFRSGDVVVRIDGRPVEGFQDLQAHVLRATGAPMNFLVRRGAEQLVLVVTPEAAGGSVQGKAKWRLGLQNDPRGVETITRRYALGPALWRATELSWDRIGITAHYLARMVTGRENASQLSGPIGIAQVAGDLSKRAAAASPDLTVFVRNWTVLTLELVAGISIGIGFLNLLPIPVLDGGHLLFYAYEAVARRPLAAKVQAAGFRVGLALVLGLMLFATWNDLQRQRVFNLIGGLFS